MLRLVEPPAADPSSPRSQTSLAYARLRADILVGNLKPGEKLKVNDIAAQLKISPGAVREALSRLVPEGIVLSRDQHGYTAAPISVADLQDLTRLRCDIEEVALRRSIAEGDAAWEALVLGAAHRLRRTAFLGEDGNPNAEWLAQHERFHAALVSGAASVRLLALTAHLHAQTERYRLLSWTADRTRDVDTEHQGLVDAALDRDADQLVLLARAHFERTAALIIEAAQQAKTSAG